MFTVYLIPMFVAGKRSWNMFYLPLRDLVLYCFKEEKKAQSQSSFESPHTAVRIQHSVAMAAQDYTKHQFVFRYGVVFDIFARIRSF